MTKALLLSFLLFCSIFDLCGQNYQCFKSGSTVSWFIDDVYYLRGIRIDSVTASGADTIYYPYCTLRTMSAYPYYDSLGASWVGKGVIKQPDGTFLFKNAYNDTVIIRTQANVGDNWIFYQDTSTLFYKAVVTSVDTMTILGALDSVKSIVVNAYNPLPDPSDFVDNFKIILSKNHGFAQVFDLYNFPYHSPDTSVINCPDVYFSSLLLSYPEPQHQIFNITSFHIPTYRELYNFHPTDVLEYNTWTYCYCPMTDCKGIEYDSILFRHDIDSFHAQVAVYKRNGVNCFPCSEPDSDRHYSYYTEIDTVVFDSTRAFIMNGLPEEKGQNLAYYYNPGDTSFCFLGKSIKSTVFNLFEGCDNTFAYKIGLGILDSDYCPYCSVSIGGVGAITSTTLIYYRKDGLSCGASQLPLTIKNETGPISAVTLSPNPVNNVLTIHTTNDNTLRKYTIINAFGQLVKTTVSNGNQVIFDVTDLSPGVYYVNIVSEHTAVLNKKIVVVH